MKNILKSILRYTLVAITCFLTGYFSSSVIPLKKKVVISRENISANTINKDIGSMSEAEKKMELSRFYTDSPSLDIEQIQGDEYKLSAALYVRSWSRAVNIKARADPKNQIFCNVLFDSHLRSGLFVQYYRTVNAFSIGGGIGGTTYDQFITCGAGYSW